MKNPFTKEKVNAKTVGAFVILTALEIIFALWIGNWQPTPWLLTPIANLILFLDFKLGKKED